MISIGFQFDYELNSKNHSKKIIKHFGFFRFFDFFDFFRFVLIFLDFFDFFGLFFRFVFDFLIFFDFNWISIGFFWISIGFQLDFFHEHWRSDKPEKKKQKNRKKNPFF